MSVGCRKFVVFLSNILKRILYDLLYIKIFLEDFLNKKFIYIILQNVVRLLM